jgi:RNA polymerase sigma-70 factor (ECF subfamily)
VPIPVKSDADVSRMIARLRRGESDAWREFVERYRRLIMSAIVRANSRFHAEWDETTMEEVFEDALFKLLRNEGKALASWKGQCRLETWIYRIVRNVCIDRLRKRSRRREREGLEDHPESLAFSDVKATSDFANRELRLSLEQVIERALSSREAIVVRLIYFEGYTYREVAERLDMSVGAMSGFVYRALRKLRESGGLSRHWEAR